MQVAMSLGALVVLGLGLVPGTVAHAAALAVRPLTAFAARVPPAAGAAVFAVELPARARGAQPRARWPGSGCC